MGKYQIALSDRAKVHLAQWKMSGQIIAIRKIERIILELSNTPYSGIGSPESLKYNYTEYWSRQINKKDRIIYEVDEQDVKVSIISAKGHYGDK
jgi:toxin YoeB